MSSARGALRTVRMAGRAGADWCTARAAYGDDGGRMRLYQTYGLDSVSIAAGRWPQSQFCETVNTTPTHNNVTNKLQLIVFMRVSPLH